MQTVTLAGVKVKLHVAKKLGNHIFKRLRSFRGFKSVTHTSAFIFWKAPEDLYGRRIQFTAHGQGFGP
jgi:hypothetical protein